MSTPIIRSVGLFGIFSALALAMPQGRAQTTDKGLATVVEGKVQDGQGHPVATAAISLEGNDPGHALKSTADSAGLFHFANVPVGRYTLRAKLTGYSECVEGPFVLHEHEKKSVVLYLVKQVAISGKDAAGDMAFSDEPAFTVAGVTDTTALGGHGSGPIVRNSNALSKETASLARENGTAANTVPGAASPDAASQEAAIRANLAHGDNAELHAQLADIEEGEGRPLDAVKEYRRAAEMQPTEPHLFAWGAELLLHHAPEPAIEVFGKGHRLYPRSSRMMLGLGAALYSQRSEEQAVQIFLEACDLNPSDPTPYLFLGRLQVTERVVPPGWTERMKRFTEVHPENAVAHYLYAVALMKEGSHQNNFDMGEKELNAAIKLDPHLGDAYVQQGILRYEREDFSGAITALQKAVEIAPASEEAHFRLAQVYRHTGDIEKANREIAEFKKLSEQKDREAERERHEIPQFVYTLRGEGTAGQPCVATPHN